MNRVSAKQAILELYPTMVSLEKNIFQGLEDIQKLSLKMRFGVDKVKRNQKKCLEEIEKINAQIRAILNK